LADYHFSKKDVINSSSGKKLGVAMKRYQLNKQTYLEIKQTIDKSCGWLASLAAVEVIEKTLRHGVNHSFCLVDEKSYLVLVLDADCGKKDERALPAVSLIDKLCRQGLIVYYYHSIDKQHHHICLALKKKMAGFTVLAHG